MIAEQLPRIDQAIEARRIEDWSRAAAAEENAADPITRYYISEAEEASAVFFSGAQSLPEAGFGKAVFLAQNRTVITDPPAFDAVLNQVLPTSGRWLAPPFDLPQRLGEPAKVIGRWVRLSPSLPLPDDAGQLLELADAEIDRLIGPSASMRQEMADLASATTAITAISVIEELEYGQQGNGWLFVVSRAENGKKRRVTLATGHRVSEDMFSRLPIAGALRDKKVLLVGCGAIGAFAAIELARAGVGEIAFCDYDLVEPGNTVRWPLGRQAWGLRKTVALQEFLVRNYPFTKSVALNGQVGAATADAKIAAQMRENPIAQIHRAICAADVVIDATASTEIQHAMAFMAREAGKPFVVGYGTLGAVGGVVARFPISLSACFVCLHEHWADGALPLPTIDETGMVFPVGCNAPTFSGGAFDLQEVSLEITRSAIGLMAPEAYDPGEWQLATLSLKEGDRRILPRWDADAITPHPRCACGNK